MTDRYVIEFGGLSASVRPWRCVSKHVAEIDGSGQYVCACDLFGEGWRLLSDGDGCVVLMGDGDKLFD